MISIVSTGLATPLGLGVQTSSSRFWDGGSGLVPNPRWNSRGFPRTDAAPVPDFQPRKDLPDRKAVKLMSRETQLAVYAAVEAGGGVDLPRRRAIAPGRIGAFAASGYEVSSLGDSSEMLAASRDPNHPSSIDVDRLFSQGRDLYNPLSPLKILPNMPLFHAGLALGLQGPHLSIGSSPAAGLAALGEAAEALAEGDCDLALVLGSDAQIEEFRAQLLVEAGVVPALAPGEGAGALLLGPRQTALDPTIVAWDVAQEPVGPNFGGPSDGGETRRELYERVLERATGPVDLLLVDLWGEPRRDAPERAALQGLLDPATELRSSRSQLGWLGAAQGIVDVGLACEAIRSGSARRALVTASGLAGDIGAVLLEAHND